MVRAATRAEHERIVAAQRAHQAGSSHRTGGKRNGAVLLPGAVGLRNRPWPCPTSQVTIYGCSARAVAPPEGGSLAGAARQRRRRRGGVEDGRPPPVGEFGNLLGDRGSAHAQQPRVEATLLPGEAARVAGMITANRAGHPLGGEAPGADGR
jgi:hypothetical protein